MKSRDGDSFSSDGRCYNLQRPYYTILYIPILVLYCAMMYHCSVFLVSLRHFALSLFPSSHLSCSLSLMCSFSGSSPVLPLPQRLPRLQLLWQSPFQLETLLPSLHLLCVMWPLVGRAFVREQQKQTGEGQKKKKTLSDLPTPPSYFRHSVCVGEQTPLLHSTTIHDMNISLGEGLTSVYVMHPLQFSTALHFLCVVKPRVRFKQEKIIKTLSHYRRDKHRKNMRLWVLH